MKVSKVVFAAALVVGAVWDVLCLIGVTPFRVWTLSFTIVAFGSIWVLLPYVFQKERRVEEKSPEAPAAMVGAAAWIVTVIACIVYGL